MLKLQISGVRIGTCRELDLKASILTAQHYLHSDADKRPTLLEKRRKKS